MHSICDISLAEKNATSVPPEFSDTLFVQRRASVWVKRLKHNLAGDTVDRNSLLHKRVVEHKKQTRYLQNCSDTLFVQRRASFLMKRQKHEQMAVETPSQEPTTTVVCDFDHRRAEAQPTHKQHCVFEMPSNFDHLLE